MNKETLATLEAESYAWIERYDREWPELARSAAGDWPQDEEWRPVSGYPAQYEVSSEGRVRSLFYHSHGYYVRRQIPRLKKLHSCRKGYRYVKLTDWACGQRTNHLVHRLVIFAFKGPPTSDDLVCGHRDGNPSNNVPNNLGWITQLENMADRTRHGRTMFGEKNHSAKLTDADVRRLRHRRNEGATGPELAEEFGITLAYAYQIANGRFRRLDS